MDEDIVPTSIGGRRCVAGGCSSKKTAQNGLSLHNFPLARPAILRQWVKFVNVHRKDWKGPTKYSVLCSLHFEENCYPARFRIMESMGIVCKNKQLEKDAVPTIPARILTSNPSLERKKREPEFPLCSTPKRPRRAFQKREVERILEIAPIRVEVPVQAVEELQESDTVEEPTQTEDVTIEACADFCTPSTETRTVGCQLSALLPQRRSHTTQTKWRKLDKATQAGGMVKTREIGVSCNLISAPPLRLLRHTPDVFPAKELSFASAETESDHETVDDGDDIDSDDATVQESFLSEYSDDSMESQIGNGREKKYLVYEGQLLSLFANCPACAQTTLGEIQRVKGSFISIGQNCPHCGLDRTWNSQPFIGAVPAGNFEISCAVLFSGSLPSKSLRMFNFLNMAAISVRTFMYHQQMYLHPAILKVWRNFQSTYVLEVLESGEPVHLGGDGRADTPGHCAKFGSYTMMDLKRNQVVDLQLVQSNEVGNSNRMEKEGLIRGIQFFAQNGITISRFVSDRHLQVAKWVRENLPDTRHCIDVWHVAKSLKKKLLAVSKEKDCQDLSQWIKSLVNHLYWVPSSTPEEENDLKWEKWTSISNHVQNIHQGHGELFPQCEHGDLDENARQKQWLRPGSKVATKLEGILNSRQMKKDIPMLSSSLQTANLEAYHSVINHFAPKMHSFSYHGMQSRLLLAGLHFNENSNKPHAATKQGNLQYKIAFPKQKKGDYTVKKVKAPSSFFYIDHLTREATSRMESATMPQCEIIGDAPPPLCQDFIHPEKNEAVEKLLTRYRRN